ncbi:MAG: hypothetical protein WBI17_08925 [Clostridiaceae bacterium]
MSKSHSIEKIFWAHKSGKSRKKGFMNIYFAGICVFILLASMSLTGEAMKGRLRRNQYEEMLQFDYRLEGYFLLLKTDSLTMEEGTAFGSLESYEWKALGDSDTYIHLIRTGADIRMEGYFEGKLRKTYDIKR